MLAIPKRRSETSQNPNQRQNHLVLSNQVPSIDNNPHSRGNLQLFSADQLETLRTMIADKVSESSRDIATEAARAAVSAVRNQNSVAVGTTPQRDTNPSGATDPPRHTTSLGDLNPLCDSTESPQLPSFPGGVLPYKGLMGTCGQPGYVFRDFCLKQGIEFIIFCLNQGIDLSIFFLNRMSFLGR